MPLNSCPSAEFSLSSIHITNCRFSIMGLWYPVILPPSCLFFQVAISASNTGGAWDNAKKYIEVTLIFSLSHSILQTELSCLDPELLFWSGSAGRCFWACSESRPQGVRPPQGSCDRWHNRRSPQGHLWPFTQHPDQAHGGRVLGLRSVLRNSWRPAVQIALNLSRSLVELISDEAAMWNELQ